jgi:hypothetical protein
MPSQAKQSKAKQAKLLAIQKLQRPQLCHAKPSKAKPSCWQIKSCKNKVGLQQQLETTLFRCW